MNSFETQRTIEKREEPILNEWDKKILFEGSKNVVDKILKEFRGRLPDGVIYPDESARPLFYLFDKIFDKIAKEKDIQKPRAFFFKTHKADTHTNIFEDEEGREIYYDEAKEKFLNMINSNDLPTHLNNFILSEFEKTHAKRAIEAERASEIEVYNEKLSSRGMIANLAVIDEFSNQGNTSKEINYAFGYEVPYFSVFGNKNKSINSISSENMGIAIDTENYPVNEATDNSTKLSYTKHPLKRSVGVKKNNDIDNKYSEVNHNQTIEDRKMMETLRKEMGEIGREISDKY
ncbi:hypothetical protein HXX01_03505 [Candidatus Nomurabacteria bacterium]|nr:hypothetical protein [Candidatus Nomurabacteria bacterium]